MTVDLVNLLAPNTARNIPSPVSTIVAPEAVSRIMDIGRPIITLMIPNTGERIIVCLKDLETWTLVTAGRTKSAETSRTPTIGIEAMTTIPANTLIK